MTEESTAVTDPRDYLNLKLVEPEVPSDNPWGDDVLNRAEIASRLTNLIRTQSVPFVVSIDGYWGTGKTFMLKRWQKDLEIQGFQSIYFNAWEDDFCDDPLLAIIGQLSIHLNRKSRFKTKTRGVVQKAKGLFRPRALSLSMNYEGLTVTGNADLGHNQNEEVGLLEDYLFQRESKDSLKKELSELATDVAEATKHPLVFIIDELDRCRPTFAIELLERVKHIFDVPNLVFVFGINRDELCSSLQSVYGEIDSGVYLRRFFDMEFTLPEADAESFCRHLFDEFELHEFFASLSQEAHTEIHLKEFRDLSDNFGKLWACLGLSLRDIDYCVRLVALVGKNLGHSSYMYPFLLGLLIPLRFKNPTLYQRFVRGDCTGSEVMNYIDGVLPLLDESDTLSALLDVVEAYLYLSDNRYGFEGHGRSPSLNQLKTLADGSELTQPDLLSERMQKADSERIERVRKIAHQERLMMFPTNAIGHLAGLINLYQAILRR